MAIHFHVTSVRPDQIYKTGVIAPYPIQQYDPVALSRDVLPVFLKTVRQGPPQLGAQDPGMPQFIQPAGGTVISMPSRKGGFQIL